MTDDLRIRYDFTIDETVDFQIAYIRSTREGSSWRRRELWKFGIALTLGVGGALAYHGATRDPPPDPFTIVILCGAALISSLVAILAFPRYYDGIVRRRTRRLLVEQFGGEGPHPCTMELRPEALRVELRNVEHRFPWSATTSIEDTPAGIEMKFTGGCALARSRAFASPEDRAAFLRRVRELVPPGVHSEPPSSE